ncbi:MAG: response regulator transcription factor [Pseudomonadota bacterium]
MTSRMERPSDDSSVRSVSTILIVDDHPLFCEALSMTLKSTASVGRILTADTLRQALTLVAEGAAPEVVLLDLNLPDVSGLDGLIRLKKAVGQTPVIVVSSLSDDKIISVALRAGASGFVPKHSQAGLFREALETVLQGESFVPESYTLVADNGADKDASTIDRLSQLTLQQARILRLVCEGRLNKQIAHDLSIAETTVKAHMTAILRKLGVQSRTQAVLIAQDANFSKLLQDPPHSA